MKTLLALAVVLGGGPPDDPVLHEARVVLKTSKGDLVLVLYPEVAPRHVRHFLRLVRSGYYDGTRFAVVIPGFILQHAGYVGRLREFTPEQNRLAAVRLPAEFGSLRHGRGVLSMARQPDDMDSGSSVFAILLGDAPQMDGNYTIFGRVEGGLEVLGALSAVPVGKDYAPQLPLNLHRAYVKGDEAAVPHDFHPPKELLVLSGITIGAGLIGFLLAGRFLPRNAGSIGLCLVICGFFIGFVAAAPRVVASTENRGALGLALFLSLLALFKLMNRFEAPRP